MERNKNWGLIFSLGWLRMVNAGVYFPIYKKLSGDFSFTIMPIFATSYSISLNYKFYKNFRIGWSNTIYAIDPINAIKHEYYFDIFVQEKPDGSFYLGVFKEKTDKRLSLFFNAGVHCLYWEIIDQFHPMAEIGIRYRFK